MHHLNNIVATQSNSFIINKKTYYITTNTNITKSLHSTVDSMTDFNLGLFESSEIGTHSICSGGAMALFLLSSKVVVFMVMIIGRWKPNS